jgi:hypothetical protein
MSPSPRKEAQGEEVQDNWDKAVSQGGCARENDALLECKMKHGDWRKCSEEVQKQFQQGR